MSVRGSDLGFVVRRAEAQRSQAKVSPRLNLVGDRRAIPAQPALNQNPGLEVPG